MTKRIPQPAGGVRIETFVPWTFVKRGAKEKMVTPSGAQGAFRAEAVQPRDAEMETPEVRALGLAHYWQQMLDTGKVGSLREIAAAEGMDLGQVSRIARLAWVAWSASGVVEGNSEGDVNGLSQDIVLKRPARMVA